MKNKNKYEDEIDDKKKDYRVKDKYRGKDKTSKENDATLIQFNSIHCKV